MKKDIVISRTLVHGKCVEKLANPDFEYEVDLVVVGLGTAGALAWIAAAKRKVKVLGIEPHNFLGGVGTGGGIHGYYHGSRGGLQEEIDEKARELAMSLGINKVMWGSWNPDAKAAVLEQEGLEAGGELWLQSRVTVVYLQANRLVGVRVIHRGRNIDVKCSIAIDASGDGEFAAMAGCGFDMGRSGDGQMQPYSMPRSIYSMSAKRAYGANFDAGYVDPTDGDDITRAILEGTRQHLDADLKKDVRLLRVVPHLGLREGRRIHGHETVRNSDILEEVRKPNVVTQSVANHDNHTKDFAFESEEAQEWTSVCAFSYRSTLLEIPYGAIVAKDVDGIYLAGRCISMEHDVLASCRMMRDMQKLGEITAIAASIALRKKCALIDVPYVLLRSELVKAGILGGKNQEEWEPWLEEVSQIREGLASKTPGLALWSVRRLGSKIVPQLKTWLYAREKNLRIHAAMALALVCDNEGIEELLHSVEKRDHFEPEMKRRRPVSTYYRMHACMVLLGKLADPRAIPVLSKALLKSRADFQDVSHALVALIKIGQQNPGERERIRGIFERYLRQGRKHLLQKMQGGGNQPLTRLNRAPKIREIMGDTLDEWRTRKRA